MIFILTLIYNFKIWQNSFYAMFVVIIFGHWFSIALPVATLIDWTTYTQKTFKNRSFLSIEQKPFQCLSAFQKVAF